MVERSLKMLGLEKYFDHWMLNHVLKWSPYGLLLWLFSRMDSDLTLWFYSKFGRGPAAFRSKVVWIVGSSSGIGEALAHILACVGSKLILSGTRKERLDQVKKRCHELNPSLKDEDVMIICFDVKNTSVMPSLVSQVLERFGRLDVLMLNAGRTQRAAFEETDLSVDRDMFEVNVFGMVGLTRIVLKHWYETSHGGQVVVTSSVTGKTGAPYSCVYTASKHALHGYFEALRNESYHMGIRVTIVCPGPVFSEIIERAYTGDLKTTFRGTHQKNDRRMSAERCAHLMLVAAANRLDESWISIQPILLYLYATQYMPSICRSLFPRIFTKDTIMKIRDGNK